MPRSLSWMARSHSWMRRWTGWSPTWGRRPTSPWLRSTGSWTIPGSPAVSSLPPRHLQALVWTFKDFLSQFCCWWCFQHGLELIIAESHEWYLHLRRDMFATMFIYVNPVINFCPKLWLKMNFVSASQRVLALSSRSSMNFCKRKTFVIIMKTKTFVDPYTVGQRSVLCAYWAMHQCQSTNKIQNIILGNSCDQNIETYIFVFSWCCWTRQNILLQQFKTF